MLTLSNLNKNVVIIYMSVFDLCMHDLYNVIEYIVKLYNELVFRLFGQMLPLRLLSVTQANTDITSIYSDTKQWKAFCEKNEEALVTVTWSFDSRKYKYAFLACKPIHFPPYTLEELRNNKPDNKIIALSTDNNDQCHDELMQYAGPMHTFYADKTKNYMKLSWLIPDATTLNLMDSKIKLSTIQGELYR